MRLVPLKTVPIRLAGQPEDSADIPFSYAANAISLINASAAERGLPLSEIEKALRVLTPIVDAQRAGAESVVLEDADWLHLKKLVEAFRGWRIIHPAVVEFVSDIARAETVTTDPAAAAAP